MIEEARAVLRTWGAAEPNFLLTNSKLTFQMTMIPEKTQYLTQGPDGVRKLAQRLHSAGGKAKAIALPAGRDELSLALGQANVVHAAVRDRQAALRVESAVGRWRAYLGLQDGIEIEGDEPPAGLEL